MLPNPPETRASLILRLQDAADVAAWDEFSAVYGPLVFRMAQRQGLQPADADDVVQEVFVAVARSVSQWLDQPTRGRFRGWLLSMARNIAINVLTRRPHGSTGQGGDDQRTLAALQASPGTLSDEFDLEYRREVFRWAADQVRDSVAESTWQAFQRTHLDGVPISDVARELGVSVGTVYVSRSRVMNRLQQLVRQFDTDGPKNNSGDLS
ncbi:MAG: sigma-70 family RNA polymerase sigma factor [Planctomycetaceae bacterium]|nr:sigma-70 family RNA polymerase sigma factor [Planctomycetaceae bacterium]